MTESDAVIALRELRDTLRSPSTLSPEDLSFRLSATLRAIGLHATSLEGGTIRSQDARSVDRLLGSIQTLLLGDIVPTFWSVLDQAGQEALRTLFVAPKSPSRLGLGRQIALNTYLSLPAYLNAAKPGQPSLPKQSRAFLLATLDSLAGQYGIDDLYYAVFATSEASKRGGAGTLRWEDAVRASVGLPAKIGNAVGRWKADGTQVDTPPNLLPRTYLHVLVTRLEGLMYELAQSSEQEAHIAPIRLVIEKLTSVGLISHATSSDARSPSFFPAFLPPLLAHLHPPSSSLPPYPADYLPSILLPLPSSTLTTFADCLLSHLSHRLINASSSFEPDVPDMRIVRAIEVLTAIVGQAMTGGEAWQAVLRPILSAKQGLSVSETASRQHARNRITVGWVAQTGPGSIQTLVEAILDIWTESKYVKFTLYAQQLNLTHLLLLALGQLQPLSPWLVALAQRAKIIMAFQSYLSHPDPAVRRLGMLVAEILSELTIPEADAASSSLAPDDDDIEALKKGLEAGEGNVPPRSGPKGSLKRLRFTGIWEGNGEGREDCRWMRRVIGSRDSGVDPGHDVPPAAWLLGWDQVADEAQAPLPLTTLPAQVPTVRGRQAAKPCASQARAKPTPKIVMLDPDQLDDPLQGYPSSEPSSSRSPSPTPSYLDEVAADPSLAVDATQKKKVSRPVYLPQLAELLKEREQPESIEMALKWGEGLVRAKREFGTELAENAVGVALLTLGLNDPFNLEDFDTQRQGLLNALVACAPKEVAPFLCEQYFNTQYSLQQKSVILTALAMGARELAGLPVPQVPSTRKVDFPSKTLPPILHRKYSSDADVPASRQVSGISPSGQLEEAISGVRNLLLSKGAKKGDDVPELARERRLKVGSKRPMVAEMGTLAAEQIGRVFATPVMAFKDIAAECFIMPLVNRFWAHLNDSTLRESRAELTGGRYHGAGTGMVLSPMALEKLLMTLAVLLHAARHSPVYLSILSPEALELAVTIGSRMPSRGSDGDATDGEGERGSAEAQVVGSTLELALVALDAAFELDSGRTLAIDKPALILGVGEWATRVFQDETEGGRVAAGQGGVREGRLRANAAGVVLKVGEIGEKWGHLGLRF
ncbi:hypothetical protein IAU60_004692 [Kwoniella sp. DSM 27419]